MPTSTRTTKNDLIARVSQYAQDPEFSIIERHAKLINDSHGYHINGVPVGTKLVEVSNTLDVMLYANNIYSVVRNLSIYCNASPFPYSYIQHTNETIKAKIVNDITIEIDTYTDNGYVGDLPNLKKVLEILETM